MSGSTRPLVKPKSFAEILTSDLGGVVRGNGPVKGSVVFRPELGGVDKAHVGSNSMGYFSWPKDNCEGVGDTTHKDFSPLMKRTRHGRKFDEGYYLNVLDKDTMEIFPPEKIEAEGMKIWKNALVGYGENSQATLKFWPYLMVPFFSTDKCRSLVSKDLVRNLDLEQCRRESVPSLHTQ